MDDEVGGDDDVEEIVEEEFMREDEQRIAETLTEL